MSLSVASTRRGIVLQYYNLLLVHHVDAPSPTPRLRFLRLCFQVCARFARCGLLFLSSFTLKCKLKPPDQTSVDKTKQTKSILTITPECWAVRPRCQVSIFCNGRCSAMHTRSILCDILARNGAMTEFRLARLNHVDVKI